MIGVIANAAFLVLPLAALAVRPSVVLSIAIGLYALADPYIGGFALGATITVVGLGNVLSGKPVPLPRTTVMIGAFWLLAATLSAWRGVDSWGLFFRDFAQVVLYILTFVSIATIASDGQVAWRRIALGIVLGAAVLSISTIARHLLALELGTERSANYVTFWSVVGCLAIPLGFLSRTRLGGRVLIGLLVFLALTTTQLNVTRTGTVLALVILSAYAWLYGYHRLLIGGLTVAGILLVATKGAPIEVLFRSRDGLSAYNVFEATFSTLERIRLLEASFELWQDAPLLGHGLGSVTEFFLTDARIKTIVQQSNPNNMYAYYAVEMGLMGLALIAALFVTAFVTARRVVRSGPPNLRFAGVMGLVLTLVFALEGLVEMLFYNARMTLLTMACFGLIYALPQVCRRETGDLSITPTEG